jgi:hypothetical protein
MSDVTPSPGYGVQAEVRGQRRGEHLIKRQNTSPRYNAGFAVIKEELGVDPPSLLRRDRWLRVERRLRPRIDLSHCDE